MPSPLTTNYAISNTNEVYTVTFESTYAPISFSQTTYQWANVLNNDHLFVFGADENMTTLDERYCTSPSHTNRSDLATAVANLAVHSWTTDFQTTGKVTVNNTTNATDLDHAAMVVKGGLAVTKDLILGDTFYMESGGSAYYAMIPESATSTPLEFTLPNTGVPSNKFLVDYGNRNIYGQTTLEDTTTSTSTTTGNLVSKGGMGVAKNSYFGEGLFVGNGIKVSSADSNQTALTYIEDYYLHTASWGGIWASDITAQCILKRKGTEVTMVVNQIRATSNTASVIVLRAGYEIPTRFRPANDNWTLMHIENNGTLTQALVTISTAGVVTVYGNSSAGSFGIGSNSGWRNSKQIGWSTI